MYKSITISKGNGGWGGPLTIMPTDTCNKIVSVTGGGIHPVAAKIAEMTGCEAIDGFVTSVPDHEMLVAVVDCGGTARCGVYPKKKVFTVNLTPVGKVGPLAQFITENLYVSAVTEKTLAYAAEGAVLTSKEGTAVEQKTANAETKNKSPGKSRTGSNECWEKEEYYYPSWDWCWRSRK